MDITLVAHLAAAGAELDAARELVKPLSPEWEHIVRARKYVETLVTFAVVDAWTEEKVVGTE